MSIRIKDDKEFDLLLESLASDVVSAHIHYRLFRDLDTARPNFSREMNESWTFWWLTIIAHRDCTLLHLGRIYDQYKGSLSMLNWLRTIQKNLHFFDEPNFRQRLQGNRFVESLAANARRPNEKELTRNIELVNCRHPGVDPAVKKLVDLRNRRLAHRSPETVLSPSRPTILGALSWEEVEQVLDLAINLLNRYCSMFKAASHSIQIVGHDDYRHILEAVRKRLQSYDEAFARLMATASQTEGSAT